MEQRVESRSPSPVPERMQEESTATLPASTRQPPRRSARLRGLPVVPLGPGAPTNPYTPGRSADQPLNQSASGQLTSAPLPTASARQSTKPMRERKVSVSAISDLSGLSFTPDAGACRKLSFQGSKEQVQQTSTELSRKRKHTSSIVSESYPQTRTTDTRATQSGALQTTASQTRATPTQTIPALASFAQISAVQASASRSSSWQIGLIQAETSLAGVSSMQAAGSSSQREPSSISITRVATRHDLIGRELAAAKQPRPDFSPTEDAPFFGIDSFLTSEPCPTLFEDEKDELRVAIKQTQQTQQLIRSEYGFHRFSAFPYVPVVTDRVTYLIPAANIGTYIHISDLWLQVLHALVTGQKQEAEQFRDHLQPYLNNIETKKMGGLQASNFHEMVVKDFLKSSVLVHLLDDTLDYFTRSFVSLEEYARHQFTLLTLRDNMQAHLDSLPALAPSPIDEEICIYYQMADVLVTVQDKELEGVRRTLRHICDLATHLLAKDYRAVQLSQQALRHPPNTFRIQLATSLARVSSMQAAGSSSQQEPSSISITRVTTHNPIGRELVTAKQPRLNVNPTVIAPHFGVDSFLISEACPTLFEHEKDELRAAIKQTQHTQQLIRSEYGLYRLSAYPYVPVGTHKVTYLIPAPNIDTYTHISNLWLRVLHALVNGQKQEAEQFRDHLQPYLTNIETKRMRGLQASNFHEVVVSGFLKSRVLEHLLDDTFDYFTRSFASLEEYARHQFTLLTFRDNMQARLDSLPAARAPSPINEEIFIQYQMADVLVTVQDKKLERVRRTLQHICDLATHLLAGDYSAARVSQQALRNRTDVFRMMDLQTALESIPLVSSNR